MGKEKKRKSISEDGVGAEEGGSSGKKKEKSEKKHKKARVERDGSDATKNKVKKTLDLAADNHEAKPASVKPKPPTYQSPISSPMADPKLTQKLHKLIGKAAKAKQLRRGIKEVCKAVRKGAGGLCVIAGDIFPLDVISHMPVLLEEARVPFCYVPRKDELGAAAATKRPTSIVLVADKDTSQFRDDLDSCSTQVRALPVHYKL